MNADIKVFSFCEERLNLPEGKALPVKLKIPNFENVIEDSSDRLVANPNGSREEKTKNNTINRFNCFFFSENIFQY